MIKKQKNNNFALCCNSLPALILKTKVTWIATILSSNCSLDIIEFLKSKQKLQCDISIKQNIHILVTYAVSKVTTVIVFACKIRNTLIFIV